MINQSIIIGRLVSDPEIKETENGKVCQITLAVTRNYKNTNGEYDNDFIPVILYEPVAESTSEYCHQDDMIGVRGRIQKTKDKPLQVVADRVTFLSSGRKGE